MTGKTHVGIGLGVASSIINAKNLTELTVGLGLTAVGALLVDCDTRGSKASKTIREIFIITVIIGILGVIAQVMLRINILEYMILPKVRVIIGVTLVVIGIIIGRFAPHRSFTHGILGIILFYVAARFLIRSLSTWFIIGYITHPLADMLTHTKVKVLYPLFSKEGVALHIITTGSKVDHLIGLLGYGICIFNIVRIL